MSNAELWEITPTNPKKALLFYKRLYPTLSGGAPTPEDVLQIWRNEYSEYRNVKSYVKEIIFFIRTSWTVGTKEKIEQLNQL